MSRLSRGEGGGGQSRLQPLPLENREGCVEGTAPASLSFFEIFYYF